MDISACIITNNNKDVLNAIDSIKEYCNEILVCETSGKNDFQNELKERNVTLFFRDWDSNFSNARNFLLEKAKCKWILIIDSDETLEGQINRLPETYKCYYVRIRNGKMDSYNARIFRNYSYIRYINAIHETVDYCFSEDEKCNAVNLIFNHKNYIELTHEEYKRKLLRNYKILLKDINHPLRDYYFAFTYSFYEKKKNLALIHAYNALNNLKLQPDQKANLYIMLFNITGRNEIEYLNKSISALPEQYYSRMLIAEMQNADEQIKQYQYILNLMNSGMQSKLSNDILPDKEFINLKLKELCQ